MQHNFILPYPTWLRGQIRCDPGGPGYEQKSHSTPCAFCTWLRPLHPREPQFYLGAFKGQCVWSILQLEFCQKLGTGGHTPSRPFGFFISRPYFTFAGIHVRYISDWRGEENILCQCDDLPININQSQTSHTFGGILSYHFLNKFRHICCITPLQKGHPLS